MKQLPFQIDLSGKTAIITGGGGVLCSGFAKTVAACGANVAILDLKLDAAQKGYIPKRWFTISPKYAQYASLAVTEAYLNDFPDKTVNARRYGGPEPKSIEAIIKGIENIIRKTSGNL